MNRTLCILLFLFIVTGCTSPEQQIKTELESECMCSKVTISESNNGEVPYLTYHMVDSKSDSLVKLSSRMFFRLMDRVKGFCDLNKKVVLRFEDKNGKEQISSVFYKCKIQFEF